MAENEFIDGLYGRMTEELTVIKREEFNPIKAAAESVEIVKTHVTSLRGHVLDTGFEDEHGEVKFFKETKPNFYRYLIYFSKVKNAELARPPAGIRQLQKFLQEEQNKLSHFLKKYREFYQYLRSGASYLDKIIFLRKENNSMLPLEFLGIDKDPYFTTSHDFIVAKISANQMMEEYLSAEISKTMGTQTPPTSKGSGLLWTASKSSLTELLYALHSTGVFNHGNMSLQQIASFLESVFNVRLGNYYRAFQELRIRKKNRTAFIDELKSRLAAKMDFDDEHPR